MFLSRNYRVDVWKICALNQKIIKAKDNIWFNNNIINILGCQKSLAVFSLVVAASA